MLCNKCGVDRPLSDFNINRSKPSGYQYRCKPCARDYYLRNREEIQRKTRARVTSPQGSRKRFAAHIKKNFGLSVHDYAVFWDEQNGRCAICCVPFGESRVDRPQVDHCHRTGFVRGLLCHGCNTALGGFEDNPACLLAASKYVAREWSAFGKKSLTGPVWLDQDNKERSCTDSRF